MENEYPQSMSATMIAPCGMNCAICSGHLRARKPCPGCYGNDIYKPKHCVVCKIKNCEHLGASGSAYCFECEKFPCTRLKQLDKRYRTNYSMSMLENLGNIKVSGIENFVEQEKQRWACPNCSKIICVHRDTCLFCGQTR